MKEVVSVSLGSSRRDHEVEVELLGEKFKIKRIGTDGDFKKSVELLKQLDGKVDSFGLGGIDIYLYASGGKRYKIRDAKKLVKAAGNTDVVDGSGLKNTLEREVVKKLQANPDFDFNGKKVLMVSAVDRFGMAEALHEAGAELIFGDLVFGLNIPIAIRKMTTFKIIARIALPIVTKMPFKILYPTGSEQEKAPKEKYKKYYYEADIIAGEIFLEYARRIVDLNDELERRIEKIREDVSGHLSLEASTIPGEYVLPKIIGRFIAEYPAVDVSLSISDTTEVIDHIVDRKIDIGFTGALPALKAKRLKFTEFIKDELVVITPPAYPQAGRKQVKIREIMSQPWVLRESGSGTRKTFATALKKAGLSERDLTHRMELASNQAILAAVEADLGISVISRWAAQSAAKAGAVGMLRVSDMDLIRNLYLVYDADKPMSRAEETFIDFVNEIKDTL